MLIFVPVRMVSERDIEALRLETTSATRHDFMTPWPVGDTVSKVRAALAGALGVSANALEVAVQPEALRVVGRSGMTTTTSHRPPRPRTLRQLKRTLLLAAKPARPFQRTLDKHGLCLEFAFHAVRGPSETPTLP